MSYRIIRIFLDKIHDAFIKIIKNKNENLYAIRSYQYIVVYLLLIVISIVGHTNENGLEYQSNFKLGSCYIENNKWIENVDKWETTKVGKCLKSLPLGMNSMEKKINISNHILIGIHGFNSSGGEWISPFLILNRDDLDIFFFRWEIRESYKEAQKTFLSDLEKLLDHRKASNPNITIIGHSCGGVLIASMLNKLTYSNQIHVHLVASPLRGMGVFTVCRPRNQSSFSEGVKLTQWRTHRRTDLIFSVFPLNPQSVELGGEVIQIPNSIDGMRIGHVRALEFVANKLNSQYVRQ